MDSSVYLHLIIDRYFDVIIFVEYKWRSRELPVNVDNLSFLTIGSTLLVSHEKV